ncbi:hypothetical protein MJ581_08445 [Escherichia coli]|nr:hypothetical protein MJ581_08445 [Escherichia coli]
MITTNLHFRLRTFDSAPEGKHISFARPRSLIDGQNGMDKVIWGSNWEELLRHLKKRARDRNFEAMQKEMYGQFENTFMMYLASACANTASIPVGVWRPAQAALSTNAKKTALC